MDFNILIKNTKTNKFRITFTPYIKEEFITNENSEKAILKILNKIYEPDALEFAKEQYKILNKNEDYNYNFFKFEKVTESFSFGHFYDGFETHSFILIGIE